MVKHQIKFYDEHGNEETWIVEPRDGETLIQALDRTRSVCAINQKTELKKPEEDAEIDRIARLINRRIRPPNEIERRLMWIVAALFFCLIVLAIVLELQP